MRSDRWQERWRLGRFEIDLLLVRHRYPTSPDRWVFRPGFIFDRKERGDA